MYAHSWPLLFDDGTLDDAAGDGTTATVVPGLWYLPRDFGFGGSGGGGGNCSPPAAATGSYPESEKKTASLGVRALQIVLLRAIVHHHQHVPLVYRLQLLLFDP
uniref:Uncharacterized protein n=1 Tax=Globodera rostochiensis TaxID=31243 RepID=A0A914HT43_GLORO